MLINHGTPLPPDEAAEIVLERVRFSVGLAVSRSFLESLEVHRKMCDYGNKLGLALSYFLLGCEVREEVSEEQRVPATWWDAILDRFGWLRWLDRAPQYRVIPTVKKHWHLCPHIDAPPNYRVHFHFLRGDSLRDQGKPL